ncbi:hypothetical protein [Paenibacillus sp. R14(2021)]|uniref:hypothetical protein n=1 Tax=Paenibacillus sp. R14(2021) TaxID=2859228 RepID=UPI001C6156FA|nr:hypothetical protein [Paenibacillus sp. R14(2021)]
MKLFKHVIFQLAKKVTPLGMIESIRQAFINADINPHDIKFFMSDSSHGISGIDQLLKQLPTLSVYRHRVKTQTGNEQRLTNLPSLWDGANPTLVTTLLRMDEVIEILAGIPRRYPINHLTLVFDSLSILRRNSKASNESPVPFVAKDNSSYSKLFTPRLTGWSDYPSPCIRLQSDWWISGRSEKNHF